MTFVRVYAGTLHNRSMAYNTTRSLQEKNLLLYRISGDVLEPLPSLGPGDFRIIMNTRNTRTGDTLTASVKIQIQLPGILVPEAAFYASFTATPSDGSRLLPGVLEKLGVEDPSIRSVVDPKVESYIAPTFWMQ